MKEIRFPSTLSMDYPGLLSEALAQVMEVPYGETLTVDLTETQRASAFGVAALGGPVGHFFLGHVNIEKIDRPAPA